MADREARNEIGAASPEGIARATVNGFEPAGDAADQAERLTMIMEAEAARSGMHGGGDEGSLDDLPYPLEDVEDVLAMEDAEDSSDDPMHAGGLTPARWMSAEEAAIHVINPASEDDSYYFADESDFERADPSHDQFDGPPSHLTPEDETLLGVDPYE